MRFSQASLTWVLDAYMIAFGSFLLLAGRVGDLIGRKRVFLAGLVVFTAASALCGLAETQAELIAARFIQGLGGAIASSVILALIVTEFRETRERAAAMSVYTFVVSSGGSIGLLAGGSLTEALSWHWIFFINLPIGVGRLRARPDADRGVARARAAARHRLARRGADDRRDDARGLRDRQGRRLRLGLGAHARLRRSGPRAARRLRGARGAPAGSDLPPTDPAGARPHGEQRRARLPDHRHVLDVRARLAVPGARARLRRAADRARVPADDARARRALGRPGREADAAPRRRRAC